MSNITDKKSKAEKAFYEKALDEYLGAVNPPVDQLQAAIRSGMGAGQADVDQLILKGIDGSSGRFPGESSIGRMAGGPTMRRLLQMLPAAAAVGGVGSAIGTGGDLITGDESRANAAMDLLGMGAGAYGMHRGRVGGTTNPARALQVLSGLLAGKVASDATQGIAGGMF